MPCERPVICRPKPLAGTTNGSEEVAVTVRLAAGVSMSPSVSVMAAPASPLKPV